jgi:iron complex outermembrane receptor protein
VSKLKEAIRNANRAKSALVGGSVGALIAMGMASAVNAQEDAMLEEVVVTGIKGSLKKSIDTKRFADSIVDAISAEDIGKFPDKNVADSLARITGVSVTRGFGAGEKIAVRGTSPQQNRTLLNGSAVASADWFVLDNPSRAFNYTLLPSTVVSSLEVYKSPQADIQEGSLGGTVYLRTRRPLEMDANTGSVQLQASYSDNAEEWDPLVSGLYSWKNDAETFGAMISLTKQDRTVQRNGTEVLGWERADLGGTTGEVWAPRAIGDVSFSQERERETSLVTLQFRPNEKSEITLNYLNSELDANNANYNNYVWFKDKLGDGTSLDPNSANVSNGAVVAGDGLNNYAEYNLIDRVSFSETESLDIDYSYDAGNFIFTAKVGTTEAEGGTEADKQYYFERVLYGANFSSLDYTMLVADGTPEGDAELSTRGLNYIQQGERLMNDEEDYFGFDFEFPVEGSLFTSFKVGFLHRDHDKSQNQTGTRFHWLADNQHESGSAYKENVIPGQIAWNDNDLGTIGDYARSGDAPYLLLNESAVDAVAYGPDAYNSPTTQFQFLPETWAVNEEITAAYFKADFERDEIRGNMGVRVVQTDVDSTGYNWEGDWVAAAISDVGGYQLLADLVQGEANFDHNLREQTVSHDYTEVLPNINIAMDLSEDTVLRLSAARVMSRPDYITIANQEGANLDVGSGSRGNPMLDPETANQFDVAYEWYFDDQALLSATWFYKDIQGSIINTVATETRFNPKSGENVQVDFSNPDNGRGAEISGVELSYQQAFGDFGLQANYTYTDADSLDDRDSVANPGSGRVAGVSNNLFNVSGYYENNMVSARLSYNYRTQYYDGISEFGSEMYIDDYGQWDMSVTVAATESIDVTFEGVNITDEDLEYYHIDESRASRVYSNGPRYVVGVNYNF